MAELTADTRAADIVENIRSTLESATLSSVKIFGKVGVFDDLESFERVADPIEKPVVGIVVGAFDQAKSADNASLKVNRLDVKVGLRFVLGRAQLKTEQAATAEMHRLAGLTRQALSIDVTRAGKADRWFEWRGEVLDGTDLGGMAQLQTRKPNSEFYTAVIPCVCGWQT